jgi:hypothetical protein
MAPPHNHHALTFESGFHSFITWCDDHAGAVAGLGGLISVAVLVFMAWTILIMRKANRTADKSAFAARLWASPLDFRFPPDARKIMLMRLVNSGKSAATNLTLELQGRTRYGWFRSEYLVPLFPLDPDQSREDVGVRVPPTWVSGDGWNVSFDKCRVLAHYEDALGSHTVTLFGHKKTYIGREQPWGDFLDALGRTSIRPNAPRRTLWRRVLGQ